jgi:hypothetical protein
MPKPARIAASNRVAFGSRSALAAAGAAAASGAGRALRRHHRSHRAAAPGPRVTSTEGGTSPPVTAQSASSPSASVVDAPGCTFTRASRTSCPCALAEVTTTKLSSPADSGCTPRIRPLPVSLAARASAATGSDASTHGPPSGYTAPSTAALSSTGAEGTVMVRTAPRWSHSASTRYSPGGTRTLTGPTPTFRPPTYTALPAGEVVMSSREVLFFFAALRMPFTYFWNEGG